MKKCNGPAVISKLFYDIKRRWTVLIQFFMHMPKSLHVQYSLANSSPTRLNEKSEELTDLMSYAKTFGSYV